MALDFIKGIMGNKDGDEVAQGEDEYYTKSDSKDDMTGKSSKMILLEPRAYSESQQIADYLKARNSVVVNLKRVTPDQAKRIVDFLSGTLYAIEGDLQKLGGGIFLCTPKNVAIEGKISDSDKEHNADNKTPRKEIKEEKNNDEGFNW